MSEARSKLPFRPGSVIGGKYRLITQIGEGAMGGVWSALHTGTHGRVAVKVVLRPDEDLHRRLEREARACATVRHKNVVEVHDLGRTEAGDPFLVMELLEGETLAELLRRRRSLPSHEAAAIGRDMARGLSAAHEKGIIHRDLKPANVFLHRQAGEDAPVVKVLDFGVSKNLQVFDGLRTKVGGPVGSPMYMSPEQALAVPDVDVRADLWSLGVVLFEMLTGEPPFSGDPIAILRLVVEGPIPSVSRRVHRIDPDLDRIVTGCLTRSRDERLGPADVVAARLDAHVSPREVTASEAMATLPAPAAPGALPADVVAARFDVNVSPRGAAAPEAVPARVEAVPEELVATRAAGVVEATVAERPAPEAVTEQGTVRGAGRSTGAPLSGHARVAQVGAIVAASAIAAATAFLVLRARGPRPVSVEGAEPAAEGAEPRGADAGVLDAGVLDAGVLDAGVLDAGVLDAGGEGPQGAHFVNPEGGSAAEAASVEAKPAVGTRPVVQGASRAPGPGTPGARTGAARKGGQKARCKLYPFCLPEKGPYDP